MRKNLYFIIALLLANFSFAQGGGFNYKALITDNGNVSNNHSVTFKFTVLENGTTAVYQETQTATTDANGIVAVNVGEGTLVSGNFTTIDWGSNPYFLKVEIDTGSGYHDYGTSELKYVPYAKFAEKAGNAFSGDFGDLSNVPTGLSDGDDDTHLTDAQITAMGYIKNPNDADHDATNELQTINKTGSTVTLSNGGGSFTDADTHLTDTQIGAMGYIKNPDDADSDDTNEIQYLNLSGTQLSLSDANNVNFTNWDTNVNDDVQSINDLSDAKTTNYGVFLGNTSGSNANSNGDLVAVGRGIMANATSADYSVGIGNFSLYSLTSGRYNVAVGYGAGHNLTTGVGNVFIGHGAGYHETGSNKLYIENSDTSNPLIYGDFGTNELTINGSLAIKDGTQGAGKVFVSDANGNGQWSNSLPKQNKILVLGALNTTMTDGNTLSDLKKNHLSGAYISYGSTTTNAIVVPINLPVGALITDVYVYYRDNTSDNYKISIFRSDITQASWMYLVDYTTQGSSSDIRVHHFSMSRLITDNGHYFLNMYPTSGDHWQGTNSTLKAVKIIYQE